MSGLITANLLDRFWKNGIKPIKETLNGKVTASNGDISNTKVSDFTPSNASYPSPAKGESVKVIMGKLVKFCSDAVGGFVKIANIVNNCTSTAANLALSAAQGKVLMDKINQLNENLKTVDITSSFTSSDSNWTIVKALKYGRIIQLLFNVNGNYNASSSVKWSADSTRVFFRSTNANYYPLSAVQVTQGSDNISGDSVLRYNYTEIGSFYGYCTKLKSGYLYSCSMVYLSKG